MLADLKLANPKQYALVTDPSPHIAGLCPRRAGKTYAGVMAALITGEAKPGSISLIISLNLKQLRRLYWAGGPSGLFTLAAKYGCNLVYNGTMLRWEHENGSIGYLLGAEDEEQLEVIRGLEADLYLIDECKSFAASKLEKMVDEIIDPQRASRRGKLIMIGTPGFIPAGPFWQATCPAAKDKAGRLHYVDAGAKDPHGRTPEEDLLWSRHTWTLKDNSAMGHQWTEALKKKKQKGWSDDHPTWCREYLGQWTGAGDGLVYRYASEKDTGKVTWVPERTVKNPAGLPQEGAPWRFIAGMDLGFEAPTALVVLAYSSKLRQLRVIWEESRRHMLVPDVAEMLREIQTRFGTLERIYADKGNLGKMVVETLIREGLPLEAADKREKLDHIELVNAAFAAGEIKVIEGMVLEEQLLSNAWDLKDGTKEELARLGRLKEDTNIPNDSTDAFLYAYRGSLHHFGGGTEDSEPEPGSPEAIQRLIKRQLAAAREAFRKAADPRTNRVVEKAPSFIKAALSKDPLWKHRHSTQSTWTGSRSS